MTSFGKRLRMLRREKDITMVELADAIGTTQPTISKYERGIHEPDLPMVKALAEYFDVSTDYLVGESDTRGSYQRVTDQYIDNLKRDMQAEGHDIGDKSKDEIIKLMIMALEFEKIYKKND